MPSTLRSAWIVCLFVGCGAAPRSPAPAEPDWWVVEASALDGLEVGTVLRIDRELYTVDPSQGERGVDARALRAEGPATWSLEGSPLVVTRDGRALVFGAPGKAPRTVSLRPARAEEATAAARAFAARPSREEACRRMDACLEAMHADTGQKVIPMEHTSLAFCETTRLGIGGRYRLMKKPVPAACATE